MKKDVTELKRMFFDILRNPQVAEEIAQQHFGQKRLSEPAYAKNNFPYHDQNKREETDVLTSNQPIILHDTNMDHHEEVEESLTIADKEKELIIKALKKHHGKRKDAAMDLGISERTLYRKLKEYNISE
jgi:DNA-binding NtrC family response regulator